MSITSNPKVSISLLAAQLAAGVKGRTDLLTGTIPASGTAVSGQLYTDVAKKTETELDSLFVANSDLRNRIKQFIASNGGHSQLDVKAVDENGAATKAKGTFVFGTGVGVATEDKTIIVTLVDKTQWSVEISVLIGDTDDDVVDKIVTAFSAANYPSMPVLVTETAATTFSIDVEAIDGGTIGNNYKMEIEGVVAGLGTLVTTQPATGSNDAVVTTFFDNLQSSRFTGINWPTAWISEINVVKTYLDDRFNSDNAILDGVAFVGTLGTFATVKALVDAQNSQSLVYGGATQLNGSIVTMFQPADWTMSYFQGIRARRLTTEASISNFIVSTSGSLDLFGGIHTASLPYFNSPLKQLSIVDPNDLYSQIEQDELEEAGFSVYGVNSSESGMITSAMVTTYTEDAAANENDSFHYLNYVDTASVCREFFFNNLKSRFSQSRLTNGSVVPGYSIENKASIEAEFAKEYKQLSQLALTVAGSEAEKFFKDNLTVTLDLANRKVTATYQLPIVTQFGTIIATAQLNFNIEEGA